jgi:predicted helicase
MRRAVAFCQSIKVSENIADCWSAAADAYLSSLPAEKKERMIRPSARHIDGTMSALNRDELLGWLKEEPESHECRILCNVRVLSEGVDVPALDAVLPISRRSLARMRATEHGSAKYQSQRRPSCKKTA